MQKKYLIFLLFILGFIIDVFAQSVSDIKDAPSLYIYGEGRGKSPNAADASALDDLVSQISIHVVSEYEDITTNVVVGDDADTKSACRSVLKTYASTTLNNASRFCFPQDEGFYAMRYIKRSELDTIFHLRRFKVKDMVKQAGVALKKREIDNALRNYYWAFCLLQSLPRPNEVVYEDDHTGRHLLITWIPELMRDIFSKLRIKGSQVVDGVMDLEITYEGKPVSSIDYTYFDGMSMSQIYSAKDGIGPAELGGDIKPERLQLYCEYKYENETHIDKEIENVVKIAQGAFFKEARIMVEAKSDDNSEDIVNAMQQSPLATDKVEYDSYSFSSIIANSDISQIASSTKSYHEVLPLEGEDVIPYDNKITDLLSSISKREYNSVQSMFTTEGWDMFNKLIKYGEARLMGEAKLSYLKADDKVVCRSVPMTFSFKNNMRKFVEDVTFTFDKNRKIESIAFGLGYEASKDIWQHEEWTPASRLFLISFLENYKTAYALERIDYIERIFDDNAVIITGTMVPVLSGDIENNKYKEHKIVKYNRQTKGQYIENLRRCFDGNEYINLRFGNNDVIKAKGGGELFSVQIRQDYYSSNYGDTGYLFLMVDLNDDKKPTIKVRTWQPEKDPNFGIWGISDFN